LILKHEKLNIDSICYDTCDWEYIQLSNVSIMLTIIVQLDFNIDTCKTWLALESKTWHRHWKGQDLWVQNSKTPKCHGQYDGHSKM
jgi:hypothetical protein